jgi:hypothetical protein
MWCELKTPEYTWHWIQEAKKITGAEGERILTVGPKTLEMTVTHYPDGGICVDIPLDPQATKYEQRNYFYHISPGSSPGNIQFMEEELGLFFCRWFQGEMYTIHVR